LHAEPQPPGESGWSERQKQNGAYEDDRAYVILRSKNKPGCHFRSDCRGSADQG